MEAFVIVHLLLVGPAALVQLCSIAIFCWVLFHNMQPLIARPRSVNLKHCC